MDDQIVLFVIIGFCAQMIDGCLGMAYGVSSTTFLLSLGVPPALASASVHTAEVVTTGVSGISHWGFGNIDRRLVESLLIPGVLGGVLGAYLLTGVDGKAIQPFIAVYLMLMGLRILWKAYHKHVPHPTLQNLIPLGFAGGFLDAIGGGGWGPVVTSTLVANGHTPRFAIGSVNTAEFFVTFAQSVTFFLFLGGVNVQVVVGLLVGGVLAAPMAAYVSKRVSHERLMLLVGLVIVALSLRTLYLTLAG